MKNSHKLIFVILCLQINVSQASDNADDSSNTSFNSGNTSVETVESDETSIKYFTEKLSNDGQTEYFDTLLVFPAIINKSLPWIKKSLTITDPKTGETYKVPMSDFIQCNGPTRSLSPAEYTKLVQQYGIN